MIPSPSPLVKIQIMGGKFCLRYKNKFCWHRQAMFCLNNSSKLSANNLNFHWRWRWWDRIQAIFLNLFYFNILYNLSILSIYIHISKFSDFFLLKHLSFLISLGFWHLILAPCFVDQISFCQFSHMASNHLFYTYNIHLESWPKNKFKVSLCWYLPFMLFFKSFKKNSVVISMNQKD